MNMMLFFKIIWIVVIFSFSITIRFYVDNRVGNLINPYCTVFICLSSLIIGFILTIAYKRIKINFLLIILCLYLIISLSLCWLIQRELYIFYIVPICMLEYVIIGNVLQLTIKNKFFWILPIVLFGFVTFAHIYALDRHLFWVWLRSIILGTDIFILHKGQWCPIRINDWFTGW